MDAVSILERIIKDDGRCDWATPRICALCPLGRTERDNGMGYMSCVEMTNIDGCGVDEANVIYKKAAENKLAELLIDRALEEEPNGAK